MHFIVSRYARRGLLSLVCAVLLLMPLSVLADDTSATPETPVATVSPEATTTPSATSTPIETATPEATATPVDTATPVETATLDVLSTPTPTEVPLEFTTTPGSTLTPEEVTPSSTPWPTPTMIIPYAYNANFNGTQFPPELFVDGHWTLVNVPGGQAVQSDGTAAQATINYIPAMFEQGRIEAFFAINAGSGGLVWGNYTVNFAPPSTITLSYNGTTLQSATLDALNSDWNYVQLTVMSDALRVAVNGIDKITTLPAEPLVPAAVGLVAAPNSMVRIDNFAIYGLPISVPMTPAPSVTPAPSTTPVPSVTPASSATPTLAATSTSTSVPTSIPAAPVFTSHVMFGRVTTVRPTVVWAPVPGAEYYEVAVVDAQTGVDYAPHQTVTTTQFTPGYNLQQKNTSFYVRAVNSLGWSDWSHIILNVVLGDTPAYGSLVRVPYPTFTWTVVPGAADYTLQVDNDQDFSSPVIDQTLTATSYVPTEAEAFSTTGVMYFWRVSASNLGFPEPNHILNFTRGTAVDGQPVITYPQQDVAVSTVRPTITWQALPWATSYEVAIVDSDTGLDVVPREIVTDTHFTPASNLPQKYTIFYVRGGSDEEGWGDWAFVYAPVVLGDSPEQNIILESPRPTFTWNAVPDATGYTLQIDNNADFSSPLVEQTTTDTSYTLTADQTLLSGPRYHWRVAASNLDYPPAVFARSFYLSVMLPGQPEVTSPDADGYGYVDTVRPTITWNAVPEATRYEVAVVDLETGIDYAPHELVTGTQFMVPYNLPQRQISFYVRAGDDTEDNWSEWTHYPVFIVLGSTPENDAYVPTSRPTFTWNAVPDAVSYTLQVDNDADFSSPLVDRTVTGTSYTLSETEALTTIGEVYYWRMNASNLVDYPPQWLPHTFLIWIYWPNITSPGYEGYVDNVRPTLTWDPVPGAISYEVAVVDSETGLDLAPHQQVTSPQFKPSFNLPQKNIGFYVRAMSDTLTSGWTYHAINIILGNTPAQGITLATTRPNFKWSSVPGASNYTLQVDDDFDFTSPLVERTLNGTSYTLTAAEALPNHLVYYWRVAASNSAYPSWGLIFSVEVPAPDAPVITFPLADSTIDTLRPTVKWQAVPGATRYELDVYDSDNDTHYGPYTTGNITQFKLPTDLPQKNLYFSLRAGNNMVWGEWTTIVVFVDVPTPNAPVITTPLADATVDTLRPTVKWQAVPGATRYELDVYDSDTDSRYGPYATGNTTQLKLPANLPQKSLFFNLRAGNDVEWSEWTTIGVTVVLGTTPAHNAVVMTTRPTFKWASVTGATSYSLQLDDNDDFSSPLLERTVTGTSYMLSAAEALTTPAGLYYWRVAASNVDYPGWWLHRTLINGVIPVPTVLYATDESAAPKTLFNRFSGILLRWAAPTPAPYSYDVQFSNTSDFADVFQTGVTLDPWVFYGADSLPEGKIYWRVRSVYQLESYGVSAWSSSKSFTVDLTPPPAAVAQTPVGEINTARPTFSWTASAGADHYVLYVYDQSTSLFVSGFPKTVNGTSYTLPSSAQPLSQGDYSWLVNAVDAAGNGSLDSEQIFFNVFSGLTPTVGQSLTDTTPRFTWKGVSGTGADLWRLEISTTVDMSTIIYTSPDLAASATSFTLPNANALPAGVYYWRVLRITESGTYVEGRELTIAP